MKITIEIDEPYLDVLRKWASVSRTLNTAKAACEFANDQDAERFNWCLKELDIIEPALNALHQIIRNEIWQTDLKNQSKHVTWRSFKGILTGRVIDEVNGVMKVIRDGTMETYLVKPEEIIS